MEINSCSDIWSLRHEQQLLIAMNGRPKTLSSDRPPNGVLIEALGVNAHVKQS